MATIPFENIPEGSLYGRKAKLFLTDGEEVLDLSEMHFRFQTVQEDAESPNNCTIRVFNLSTDTQRRAKREYSRVILQAGYEKGPFGVIFDGTIKQYRMGKQPDQVTSYLDILAADGDLAYNFGVINKSLAAGSSSGERVAAMVESLTKYGISGATNLIPSTGGILPRGKVLFGLSKGLLRSEVATQGASWSIQNGRIQIIPLDGYLPGEAVVLTSQTGLIGRAEQTAEGIKCRSLLNPKILIGGAVQIDNKSINQTLAAPGSELPVGQSAFNSWTAIQQLANIADDGLYRVYVCEHVGDTRGQDWYSDLVCLTINPVTNTCKKFG
jgi:hypothetical protein